jgi:hypothetical protein
VCQQSPQPPSYKIHPRAGGVIAVTGLFCAVSTTKSYGEKIHLTADFADNADKSGELISNFHPPSAFIREIRG